MPTLVDRQPAAMRQVMANNGEDVSRVPHVAPAMKVTPELITTAAAVTYTPTQLMSGYFHRDPNGAGRADLLPTADVLLAAIPGAFVDQSFYLWIRNIADAAETITVTGATGAGVNGTATIGQNNTKAFLLRVTNITPGARAYTLYSLGTFVH